MMLIVSLYKHKCNTQSECATFSCNLVSI